MDKQQCFAWVFEDCTNLKHIDFTCKDDITRLYIESMLQRTNSMFEWKGLPETIPQHYLESLLQINGSCGIIKHNDKLFAVRGNAGGMRNYNYEPSQLIVANPYLMIQSKMYEIFYGNEAKLDNPPQQLPATDSECVVIVNDNFSRGLMPLCQFYASLLTENTISKRMVSILSRISYIFVAGDSDTKKDFEDLLQSIVKGEFGSVLAERILGSDTENAQTLPFADRIHEGLTDLIENEQYIKASWYNDLGLQANYNMKRESINANESQLNKDAVLPFVDTMLAMRKLACKRINALYGTNWSVDFNSAWNYTRVTIEQAIDAIDQTSETKVGDEDEVDSSQSVVEEKEVEESNDNE